MPNLIEDRLSSLLAEWIDANRPEDVAELVEDDRDEVHGAAEDGPAPACGIAVDHDDVQARLCGVGGGGNAPPGWTDKVIKKVKPLIVFNPESISGNPAAVILVSLAPDGAILSTSIQSSSGNAGWDRAVLLALSRAESLPKDDNGKIPQREVKLTFKPKD